MTAEGLLALLEKEVAPLALSNEFCSKFGAYDNSGIIIDCGGGINGVLFSLDLSKEAVKRAKEQGFNAIVTHHPAIYGGIKSINVTKSAQAEALSECVKGGISVISMHLNFDAAPKGIDYYLMKGLGGEACQVKDSLTGGGYGRVYKIAPIKLAGFVARIKQNFGAERIAVYGDGEREISCAASFCGAGCDEGGIDFAKALGAQVFVSSDLKHHEIVRLTEEGISVVAPTHYCAETYGFKQIYNDIKNTLTLPSGFFVDGRFM